MSGRGSERGQCCGLERWRVVMVAAAMDFGRVTAGDVFGSGIALGEKGSYRVVGVEGIESSTKITLCEGSKDGRSSNVSEMRC